MNVLYNDEQELTGEIRSPNYPSTPFTTSERSLVTFLNFPESLTWIRLVDIPENDETCREVPFSFFFKSTDTFKSSCDNTQQRRTYDILTQQVPLIALPAQTKSIAFIIEYAGLFIGNISLQHYPLLSLSLLKISVVGFETT